METNKQAKTKNIKIGFTLPEPFLDPTANSETICGTM
jgi:hypothetical protein